ncbi:MAG TPA: dockerin type I repeat-containing protein, partial [Sedimentisphaerales bacterium]|nr:dockerin type I repeat-containing protein [Sedimentisphaerales bacterium]
CMKNIDSMIGLAVFLVLIFTGIGTAREKDSTPRADPASGEQINWQVISSGGTRGASTSFILSGTVGQTAVGYGSSVSFGLSHGFWQEFGEISCCVGLTGNVDGDPQGIVDIGDLTFLIRYLFIPPTVPPDCMEEANIDGDEAGVIDIGDLTALIDYLFISNTPPEECQ